MSFFSWNDLPGFVLFIPIHKSLSLGLSETYFPAETAFLNSIRSHRRQIDEVRARRAKSKKREPRRSRKANRCPLTALSLFDSMTFTCYATHIFTIDLVCRNSPLGISLRRQVFARVRSSRTLFRSQSIKRGRTGLEISRIGTTFVIVVNQQLSTTVLRDLGPSRFDYIQRGAIRDRSIFSSVYSRPRHDYLFVTAVT